jgi:hypothetical protein
MEGRAWGEQSSSHQGAGEGEREREITKAYIITGLHYLAVYFLSFRSSRPQPMGYATYI